MAFSIFRRSIQLLFLLSFSIFAIAQEKDTLYLLEQSPVAGELKSIIKGKLEFDVDGLDLSTVKITKIRTVKAVNKLFRIQLKGMDLMQVVSILPSPESGAVLLVNDIGDTIRTSFQAITFLVSLSKSSGVKWRSNIGAGYSFTRSSNIGRMNLNASLQYFQQRTSIYTNYSGIYTLDSGVLSRDREQLNITGNYRLKDRWYAIGMLSYQRNKTQGLASRFQQGLGIGHNFWAQYRKEAYLVSGLVLNQEKAMGADLHAKSIEWPLLMRLYFYNFSRPDMSLSLTEGLYKDVKKSNRIRIEGDVQLKIKLVTDLNLLIQFYHSYDSAPLSPAGIMWDYGTVFSITYELN